MNLATVVIDPEKMLPLIENGEQGIGVIKAGDHVGIYLSDQPRESTPHLKTIGYLPPMRPKLMGDAAFLKTHGATYPYIVGEMANGIASAQMVIAAARAGLCGFFGSAGLAPAVVEKNILEIQKQLGEITCWGSNLIHTPQEPSIESAIVDLYLRLKVRRVSTSAYLSLSPHVVRYAFKGITQDSEGNIIRPNHVIAKLSRPEVARHFISPPPAELLASLVSQGHLTAEEARLAATLPVAEDITVEADSGGHTDNRPLCALYPTIRLLAFQLTKQYQYRQPIRVGAAGGIGTPTAVAAAFAMGAAYVLTGSINQAAVESGLSEEGRKMLLKAGIADVMMAPAADMFELGVKVQILKRGTLFGTRAQRLYEIYSKYEALEAIPEEERLKIEQQFFLKPVEDVWKDTRIFFEARDPKQVERALKDPKHRMALVFRWYLGFSSRWPIMGDQSRAMDYQIWCGPAMGAFNAWVEGTFLQELKERTVVQMGMNLLEGAAILLRAQQLRGFGIALPPSAFDYRPKKFKL